MYISVISSSNVLDEFYFILYSHTFEFWVEIVCIMQDKINTSFIIKFLAFFI